MQFLIVSDATFSDIKSKLQTNKVFERSGSDYGCNTLKK